MKRIKRGFVILAAIIGVSVFLIANDCYFGLTANASNGGTNKDVPNFSKQNSPSEQFKSSTTLNNSKENTNLQKTESSAKQEGQADKSELNKAEERKKPVAYLTFDDGPSQNTLKVLQILEDYGIKATFFVTGQACENSPHILQQIAAAGHSLGNHSYSHNYKLIYNNPQAFMQEIEKTDALISQLIGKETDLVRFPGGSYPKPDQRYTQLLAEGGYVYFDWNVDSRDSARKKVRSQEIIRTVTEQVKGKTKAVILMHDNAGKQSTVEALPQIIENLQARGFEFAQLSREVTPVQFKLRTEN